MIYKIFYYLMLIGYIGVSIQGVGIKAKILGLLLALVNGMIFWR